MCDDINYLNEKKENESAIKSQAKGVNEEQLGAWVWVKMKLLRKLCASTLLTKLICVRWGGLRGEFLSCSAGRASAPRFGNLKIRHLGGVCELVCVDFSGSLEATQIALVNRGIDLLVAHHHYGLRVIVIVGTSEGVSKSLLGDLLEVLVEGSSLEGVSVFAGLYPENFWRTARTKLSECFAEKFLGTFSVEVTVRDTIS